MPNRNSRIPNANTSRCSIPLSLKWPVADTYRSVIDLQRVRCTARCSIMMAARDSTTFPRQQQQLVERFLPRNTGYGAPSRTDPRLHVTLTYAMSLDAQIALAPGVQTAISGAESKGMTHFLRSRHEAILVGAGTANADDPSLNSRHIEESRERLPYNQQPVPIIFDPKAKWMLTSDAKVLRLARSKMGKPPLWLVDEKFSRDISKSRQAAMEEVDGQIITGSLLDRGRIQWQAVFQLLLTLGLNSVMIEGGGQLIRDLQHASNIEAVNSLIVTIAPKLFGMGGINITPATPEKLEKGVDIEWMILGQDAVMLRRFRQHS